MNICGKYIILLKKKIPKTNNVHFLIFFSIPYDFWFQQF